MTTLTETPVHAAESTHYYRRDGAPCYEVPAKSGAMRPTTLRDARTMNLVPSVTSIIRCAAAPGLELWKQQQVLHAALTLPLIPGETEDAYLARIMADSREQAKRAAERGTAIHAWIQGVYEGSLPADYCEHVIGTQEAVMNWAGDGSWDTERTFAHPLGYGGKIDISTEGYVADFKTTEKPLDDIKVWDEHALQLSAYREGIGAPTARCAIVYVSVTNPGQAKVIEIPEEELQRGWAMFQALLSYWYAKTGLGEAK